MVTNGRVPANFVSRIGGMNTDGSSHTLPEDVCELAVNTDVVSTGNGGSVHRTRRGTVLIKNFTGSIQHFPVVLHNGLPILLVREDNSLDIGVVIDDEFFSIRRYNGVFNSSTETVRHVVLPGETVAVLLLCASSAPLLVRLHELQAFTRESATAVEYSDQPNKWASIASRSHGIITDDFAFQNGLGNTTYASDTVTLNLGVTAQRHARVCMPSLHWVPEALLWFGDRFFDGVNRGTSVPSDQHVLVPTNISSDRGSGRYKYSLYSDTRFNSVYPEATDRRPKSHVEWAYGNGVNYTYDDDPNNAVSPTPFVTTFGKVTNGADSLVLPEDIDYTADTVRIVDHDFTSGDAVTFDFVSALMPPLVAGTTYYVEVVDADNIKFYTDAALTTPVTLTTPISNEIPEWSWDYDDPTLIQVLDGGSGTLVPVPHGLSSGSAVRLFIDGTYPEGLAPFTTYYAEPVSAHQFRLYYDKERNFVVSIARQPARLYDDTDVDTVNDTITVLSSGIIDSSFVYFDQLPGSTLTPDLKEGFPYIARLVATDTYSFYDTSLSFLADLTAAGIGLNAIYTATGRVLRYQEVHEFTVRRVFSDKVYYIRYRELRFNAGRGIEGRHLRVVVNDVVITANYTGAPVASAPGSRYFLYDDNFVLITDDTTVASYISFNATQEIGIAADAVVQLVNVELKHLAPYFTTTPTTSIYDNGSWWPFYGVGLIANYDAGVYPQHGYVAEDRLMLFGFNNQSNVVLVSWPGEYKRDEFYNFLQFTDDLEGDPRDPFEIAIPAEEISPVTSVQYWRNVLFVFTYNAIHQNQSEGILTGSAIRMSKVAEHGAVTHEAVTIVEQELFYLSAHGLFALTQNVVESYKSNVLTRQVTSLIKQEAFRNFPAAYLVYDRQHEKVFIAANTDVNAYPYCETLLIYHLLTDEVTLYEAATPFLILSLTKHYDTRNGQGVLASGALQCDFGMYRFDYELYADYCVRKSGLTGTVEVTPRPVVTIEAGHNNYARLPWKGYAAEIYNPLTIFTGTELDGYTPVPATAWTLDDDVLRLTGTFPDDLLVTFEPSELYCVWVNGEEVPYDADDVAEYLLEAPCEITVPRVKLIDMAPDVESGSGGTFVEWLNNGTVGGLFIPGTGVSYEPTLYSDNGGLIFVNDGIAGSAGPLSAVVGLASFTLMFYATLRDGDYDILYWRSIAGSDPGNRVLSLSRVADGVVMFLRSADTPVPVQAFFEADDAPALYTITYDGVDGVATIAIGAPTEYINRGFAPGGIIATSMADVTMGGIDADFDLSLDFIMWSSVLTLTEQLETAAAFFNY